MGHSWHYAAVLAGAAGVACALMPLAIVLATRCGIVDLPNARKIHSRPIPRIGGLTIALAMLGASIPWILTMRYLGGGTGHQAPLVTLIITSTFVLAVGLADDVLTVPSKFKLLALLAAAVALCGSGARIESIGFGNGFGFKLGWFTWPVTVLWIVGVTVSISFIDGLDGLAGGIVAIASAVVAVVQMHFGHYEVAILALALCGSLCGFLVFNFNPAKVFMGDCGSLFIGFVLASTCVMSTRRVGTMGSLVLPAMTLSVPLLDTALTLVRRAVQRRSIFSAEQGHIHHRLLDAGLGQRHATLLLWGVTVAAAAAGLVAVYGEGWYSLGGLTLLVPLLLGVFRGAGSVRARETIKSLRRNRAMHHEHRRDQGAYEEMQNRFRHVRDFQDWWREVCSAADLLGLSRVLMSTVGRDGVRRTLAWEREVEASAAASARRGPAPELTATLPINQRRQGQKLEAEVAIPLEPNLEAAGHRLAIFARLLEEFSLLRLPEDVVQYRPADERKRLDPVSRVVVRTLLHPLCGRGSRGRRANASTVGRIGDATGRRNGLDSPNGQGTVAGGGLGVGIDVGCDLAVPKERAATAFPTAGAPSLPRALTHPKVAVVHDFLYTYAGAERVLEQILQVYPEADLFSLFDFLPDHQRGFILNKPVKTSFIQKLPMAERKHRAYLPLMPLAVEQLDVTGYDIVISSSYMAAKGVITRPDQLHVCYCHSPVRYAWDLQHQYLAESNLTSGLKAFVARMILHYIRLWDVRTAAGVDAFIANSDFIARRIEKVYRRSSTTIYPPVDVERFGLLADKEDYYVTASRMVPYKRMDVIVEAFNRMPERRLIVVGDGPEFDKIKAKAGPNVRLVGYQPFERLRRYMQLARAFVFAAEEDFGIVPVEAQACGTPVIAFSRGGVGESVIPGKTGVFFDEQTPESIVTAVEAFERVGEWDAHAIRENALRFSNARFREELGRFVSSTWMNFSEKARPLSLAGARAAVRAVPFAEAPQHLAARSSQGDVLVCAGADD